MPFVAYALLQILPHTKRNPQVELVLVMIVAPTVLNAVQFWVRICL